MKQKPLKNRQKRKQQKQRKSIRAYFKSKEIKNGNARKVREQETPEVQKGL